MENCNKKPTPTIPDDWLNKWLRAPKIQYGVDFGTGNCVSAEITVNLPTKEELIRSRIHQLNKVMFEYGIQENHVLGQILHGEVEFLKLLL